MFFNRVHVSYLMPIHCKRKKVRGKKEKEKKTLMLPPVWIMVLLHFQVGLSLKCNLESPLWELEGLDDYGLFWRWTHRTGADKPSLHLTIMALCGLTSSSIPIGSRLITTKCLHRGANFGPSIYKIETLPLSYKGNTFKFRRVRPARPHVCCFTNVAIPNHLCIV